MKSLVAQVSPIFRAVCTHLSSEFGAMDSRVGDPELAAVVTESSDEEPPPPTALHGINLLVPGGQSVSGVVRSNFHLNHEVPGLLRFDATNHWHRQHLSAICAGPNGCSSRSPLSQFGQQWTWKWLDVHMLPGPHGPSKSRLAPTLCAFTSTSSAPFACWTYYNNNNWSIYKPSSTISLSESDS